MTQVYPPVMHPERRAFLVSLALHALLFLFIVLFADLRFYQTLTVTIVNRAPQPTQEIVEEELQEEITRPANSTGKKVRPQKDPAGAAGSRRKGKTNSKSETQTLADPWSQYEQQMHSRASRGKESGSGARTESTSWGSEATGKSAKRGEAEKVNIPKGDSSAATRWRKGAARRLISMPAIDYPESVRKKSGQGKVELLLEVDAQGRVESVEILKSSGITRLDISARNAYRNAVFSPSLSGETATGVIVVTFKMRD